MLASRDRRRAMADAGSKNFNLAELIAKCEQRGSPYLEFLRVPQLSCGLYRLGTNARDTQSAHDEDEVYFVIKGRARMIIAGTSTPMSSESAKRSSTQRSNTTSVRATLANAPRSVRSSERVSSISCASS